jgi:hypothetical protein
MNLIDRRLAVVAILAAISIGLLVQFLVWRTQAIGVDWVSAIMGLAAAAILFIAGMMFYHQYCYLPGQK